VCVCVCVSLRVCVQVVDDHLRLKVQARHGLAIQAEDDHLCLPSRSRGWPSKVLVAAMLRLQSPQPHRLLAYQRLHPLLLRLIIGVGISGLTGDGLRLLPLLSIVVFVVQRTALRTNRRIRSRGETGGRYRCALEDARRLVRRLWADGLVEAQATTNRVRESAGILAVHLLRLEAARNLVARKPEREAAGHGGRRVP